MEELKDQIKEKEVQAKKITKMIITIAVCIATVVAVVFMYLDKFGVVEAPEAVIELVPDSLKLEKDTLNETK